MKSALARIFDEILREVEANPALRARLEHALTGGESKEGTAGGGGRPRNRRAAPALDPYVLMPQGEDVLRAALAPLSLEQLRDVISAFSLDSSRLALKWKDRQRLIELIVTTVQARIEKGDAFRAQTTT